MAAEPSAAAELGGDAREDFKNAVKAYIDLHDDIQAGARHLRELRKRKTELARVILQFMKENEIDECALHDGKLIRRQTKRLEPLKKEHILDELRTALRDDSRANAALVNIYAKRGVDFGEALKRTRTRGAAGGGGN